MADYGEILDDEIIPDAPIASLLGFRFRDNPLAIAEGAIDAPRIQLAALPRLEVGSIKKLGLTPERVIGSTSFVEILRAGFIQEGTIRLSIDYAREVGGGAIIVSLQVSRIRAGTPTVVASTSTTSSTYATWTADIPVLPGDTVLLEGKSSSASGEQGLRIENSFFCTSGDDLYLARETEYEYAGFWS